MEKTINITFEPVRSSWIIEFGYLPEYQILIANMRGVYYAYRGVSKETLNKLRHASSIIDELERQKLKFALEKDTMTQINQAFLGKKSVKEIELPPEVTTFVATNADWFQSVVKIHQGRGGLMGSVFHALGLWTDSKDQYKKLQGTTKEQIEGEIAKWIIEGMLFP